MLHEGPSTKQRKSHTPDSMQSSPRYVPAKYLLGATALLLCSLNAIANAIVASSGGGIASIAVIMRETTTSRNHGIFAFRPPSPPSYALLQHHRWAHPKSRYLSYIKRPLQMVGFVGGLSGEDFRTRSLPPGGNLFENCLRLSLSSQKKLLRGTLAETKKCGGLY